MLEPQQLFPQSLGIEWGWTQQQCRRALTVPMRREDARFATVEVQADGMRQELSLCFDGAAPGKRGGLVSIQTELELPRELDPSWFVEDREPDGDDEREWREFYEGLESRQQNIRDLFETARAQYSQTLGPSELFEDKNQIGTYCSRTQAVAGWRLNEGDLEILVDEEDSSDWMLLSVRAHSYPPGSIAFWFARRAPRPSPDP